MISPEDKEEITTLIKDFVKDIMPAPGTETPKKDVEVIPVPKPPKTNEELDKELHPDITPPETKSFLKQLGEMLW